MRTVKRPAATKPRSLTPADRRRAARHLRTVDPVMASIVAKVGACRLDVDRRLGPFAYLVAAIVHQQITGKAAASICKRLCTLNRGRWPRPDQIAAASDEALRACGLSRQKIGYLRDLTAHEENGPSLRRLSLLPDEEVIEALTAVRGIGRWTAEMYLMFRLGRPDVLPVDDLGVRKAMQRAYRKRALPKPDWMRKQAESWRPWRTVASWYLWRSLA
jgi:DNA-3-methyladenine glycosylase II